MLELVRVADSRSNIGAVVNTINKLVIVSKVNQVQQVQQVQPTCKLYGDYHAYSGCPINPNPFTMLVSRSAMLKIREHLQLELQKSVKFLLGVATRITRGRRTIFRNLRLNKQ